MLQGISASTAKAYTGAQETYTGFCSALQVATLPCSTNTLLRYIAWLKSSKNLAPSTIRVHLAAVRHLHAINGFSMDPVSDSRVALARAAATRRTHLKDKRDPLSYDDLKAVFHSISNPSFGDEMFLAAALLGFCGML